MHSISVDNDPRIIRNVLHVVVTRVMFDDFFVLLLDNGHTEELEVEDAKQWFKDRGADMDVVDKALDHCWNFLRAEVNINNPREPTLPKMIHAPKID